MSFAYRVLFAVVCKNTHHRLALDALRRLAGERADEWRNLFLSEYEAYLQGSKAPDDEFKDFQNHVLHVGENYWGGATKAAQLWYKLTVTALRNADWRGAVYSAGVMSHYVTDPCMPLHTGQTEAEGKIHRAAEWSIAKSYVELQNIVEQDLGGYPQVEIVDSPTWLSELIRAEADTANTHYQTFLDHYNLEAGVKNPPLGLDQELKDVAAQQIARAVSVTAAVLDRALAESQAEPPRRTPNVAAFLAGAMLPIYWVTKSLHDASDRAAVEAIYHELQATGKVAASLPEDDRVVRRLHAEQVLKTSPSKLEAERLAPTGAKHGQGTPPRERSNRARVFVDMPSISLPRLPKVKLPSVPLNKLKFPNLTVAKTAVSNAKSAVSKLKVPKLALPKLPFGGKAKTTPAAEPAAELKTAVDSPPRPLKRTDLDRGPSPERASSPLMRRNDPAEKLPSPPKQSPATSLRFHLETTSPIEDAPSIGPKRARRLESIGIKTVADLLDAHPQQVSRKLNASFITPELVAQWQREATLVCRVPNLRGHDAQMLVGARLDEIETLADQTADDVLSAVEEFLQTPEGERVLRGNARPDLDEVTDWITWARQARPLQTA